MGCLCETNPRLACLTIFMIGYMFLGALIFRHFELDQEKALRNELREFKSQFLLNNTCLNGKAAFSDIIFHYKQAFHSKLEA